MRQTALFYKVAPDFGRRVAAGLGLDAGEVAGLAGVDASKLAELTAD